MISNFERNLEWLQEQAVGKGLEKGLEKGLVQGRTEAMEQAAVNMFREGLDIPFVAKVTGLPEQRLKLLKEQLDRD
ncbi:hypothetical protein [Paenibacillus sp. SYP-B4298]|uniref:hypothetical protein n=1 Tax=Paenibacillus sp. SYP-B4298 TaxID=2996034 RepID=UPI0022DD5778|nr:hypothetical protein [Paenibacillus sp. SYP-B4298]